MFKKMYLGLALLLSAVPAIAMEQSDKPVFAFDLDDVMSKKQKLSYSDYVRLFRGLPVSWYNTVWMVAQFPSIQANGMKTAQTTNGTSNVILKVLTWLKDEKGYKNLDHINLPDLVAQTVKPDPIMGMVDIVKQLRAQGYTVIAATNQDRLQYDAWQQKMRAAGVNPSELFNAVVVARADGASEPRHAGPFTRHAAHNMYELNDPQAFKPYASYFAVVKQAAQDAAGRVPAKIIFTDDKKENIAGATQAGLDAIHFVLPNDENGEQKSARRATDQELADAVRSLKDQFAKRGVVVK